MPDTMREFAGEQMTRLLEEMVFAMQTALKLQDPESVHKMRVSIRRFQQALRVFEQYLDRKGAKRLRTELRVVMKAAGELRNRDIALELLGDAGRRVEGLVRERAQLKREFVGSLRRACHGNVRSRWRKKIGLPA